MKIHLRSSASIAEVDAELVILPVAPKEAAESSKGKKSESPGGSPFDLIAPETREALIQLNTESNGAFKARLKHLKFKPNGAERSDIAFVRGREVLTVRLFKVSRDALTLRENGIEQWRKVGGDAIRSAARAQTSDVVISLRAVSKQFLPEVIEAVSEGIRLASYEYRAYKSGEPKKSTVTSATLLLREKGTKKHQEALKRAEATANSIIFARDLINTPPADLLPKEIVAAARQVKSKVRRAKLKVYGEKELRGMRANLILAVSRGSETSPYLIHLSLPSKGRTTKRVVLIGKGVTFDSGGLCIKPGKSMEDMKCDMSGAAAVLATFQAASQLDLKGIELHAIVPTTENSVSASAMCPGDIVRSMNGKTVEILNTDAEGRLILADALTYSERLKPDLIIDLATLTGACVVALGDDYAGLFTKDRPLRDRLLEASRRAGELLWPLPLADEYKGQLKGQVGDLRNIGSCSGAGATIGALFLQEFVPAGVTWAHIDIAGPAFNSRGGDYWTPGATGYGVRLLLRFLAGLQQAEE